MKCIGFLYKYSSDKKIKYINKVAIEKYNAICPSTNPLNKNFPIINRNIDIKIKYVVPFMKE